MWRRVDARTGGILVLLLLALSVCHRPAAPRSQQPTSAVLDPIAALRDDLTLEIERDAPAAQHVCGRAKAFLSEARGARPEGARRLLGGVRSAVAPALASGNPDYLVDMAARLVPLVPDSEKRVLIGELAHLYERGLKGWGLYRAVMPAIAPHLTIDEGNRFAAAVSASKEHSCFRTIVLAHLADVGRVSPTDAFAAMKASRDLHCLDFDELQVLRLAPSIDAGLVDGALHAIPPTWRAESRAFAVSVVAVALPAPPGAVG